ncbi:universal stress protein [Halohasta litorea]|uniref:Universal stress protein n=1 Tax=Halohasta litorea TaxID=869891 RepID=A0ABD6D8G5_9EURY|nr:universal stress protein [Halohasta litorea]
MYDRILVPVDGSDAASAALDHALDIAAEHDSTVDAINVADTNVPSQTRVGGDVVDALVESGTGIVEEARDRGEDRGVTMTTNVIQGTPTDVIIDYADTYDCGLIVMGNRGNRNLGEYVLGSTTDQVVTRSDRQVCTVRATDAQVAYPYETILVPTDGSQRATEAVELASEIAATHGAALHLLVVIDELPVGIGADAAAEQSDAENNAILESAADHVAGDIEVTTAVRFGSIRGEITDYATDVGADCIVMGTHGREGFNQHLLGSTTERVLRTTPVPVLTIGSREQ